MAEREFLVDTAIILDPCENRGERHWRRKLIRANVGDQCLPYCSGEVSYSYLEIFSGLVVWNVNAAPNSSGVQKQHKGRERTRKDEAPLTSYRSFDLLGARKSSEQCSSTVLVASRARQAGAGSLHQSPSINP